MVLFAAPAVLSADSVDEAIALYNKQDFAGACANLKILVANEPQNPRAWHYLGMSTLFAGGPDAIDQALPAMEQAAKLAREDSEILENYGEVAIEYASRHTSIPAALRGRDALESCLKLDPNNLRAREVLYNFYTQAPWPIGSRSKANAQLDQIRQRDQTRAQLILINAKIQAKAYPEAFAQCDEFLQKYPHEPLVLIQYGFAAVLSGLNSERGLACLQGVVTLDSYPKNAPAPTNAWHWIGNLQERLGHRDEARTAYQRALELDPKNKWAQEGLARVK